MNAVPQFQPTEEPQALSDEQGQGPASGRSLASGRKALVVWGLVLATLLIAITIAATATVFAWPAVA
jgi:hypothetical protein